MIILDGLDSLVTDLTALVSKASPAISSYLPNKPWACQAVFRKTCIEHDKHKYSEWKRNYDAVLEGLSLGSLEQPQMLRFGEAQLPTHLTWPWDGAGWETVREEEPSGTREEPEER